jgi:hypothetical protein
MNKTELDFLHTTLSTAIRECHVNMADKLLSCFQAEIDFSSLAIELALHTLVKSEHKDTVALIQKLNRHGVVFPDYVLRESLTLKDTSILAALFNTYKNKFTAFDDGSLPVENTNSSVKGVVFDAIYSGNEDNADFLISKGFSLHADHFPADSLPYLIASMSPTLAAFVIRNISYTESDIEKCTKETPSFSIELYKAIASIDDKHLLDALYGHKTLRRFLTDNATITYGFCTHGVYFLNFLNKKGLLSMSSDLDSAVVKAHSPLDMTPFVGFSRLLEMALLLPGSENIPNEVELILHALKEPCMRSYSLLVNKKLSAFDNPSLAPVIVNLVMCSKSPSYDDLKFIVDNLPSHFTKVEPEELLSEIDLRHISQLETTSTFLELLSESGLNLNKTYLSVLLDSLQLTLSGSSASPDELTSAFALVNWLSVKLSENSFRKDYLHSPYKDNSLRKFVSLLRTSLNANKSDKSNQMVFLLSLATGSEIKELINTICIRSTDVFPILKLALSVWGITPLEALKIDGLSSNAKKTLVISLT